jgi:hypothetical protein
MYRETKKHVEDIDRSIFSVTFPEFSAENEGKKHESSQDNWSPDGDSKLGSLEYDLHYYTMFFQLLTLYRVQ